MAVVTFNPETIPPYIDEVDTGEDTNTIAWEDIYSDWKRWFVQEDNSKYPIAFTIVGGEPRSDDDSKPRLGITYFLQSPWKFRPASYDHNVVITGNYVYNPAGYRAWVPPSGSNTVGIEFESSSIVDTVVIATDSDVLDANIDSIAVATRDKILSDSTPFAGANIDTKISSRSSGSVGLTVDQEAMLTHISSSVDSIYNIEHGRWKIENNQMIFYKSDNVTEIMRFDLYDSDGEATSTSVYDRRRSS